MTIIKLESKYRLDVNRRLRKAHNAMQGLIDALNEKKLSAELVALINSDVKSLNTFQGSERELRKVLIKTKSKILKLIEKELKLLPSNHYRSVWTAFGMMIGLALSSVSGNPAGAGLGLTLGMVIGMAYGSKLDKRVAEEGRQLEVVVV